MFQTSVFLDNKRLPREKKKQAHKSLHCSVTQQGEIIPSYVMQKDKLNIYSTFH